MVLVNAPGDVATDLAKRVVEERMVACVNLLPGVQSVYRWQGHVEVAQETMMILKTTRDRVEALKERVGALHPYDVPEFVVLESASSTDAAYASWVRESVS